MKLWITILSGVLLLFTVSLELYARSRDGSSGMEKHFRKIDADYNAALSREEWNDYYGALFEEIDMDKDGSLSGAEYQAYYETRRSRRGKGGGERD